jgi:hypothetical protein
MKEPRLLPKKPNSVTPSDLSLDICDSRSLRIAEMRSRRIAGSAAMNTAVVVS